jgi:hypothetical protein
MEVVNMKKSPAFLTPLLSTLEPIYKEAQNLSLEKIAFEQEPIEELIKLSNDFRELFKKEALKEGYTDTYVQGVFNEAEALCKKAGLEAMAPLIQDAVPAVEEAVPAIEEAVPAIEKAVPAVGNMASKAWQYAKGMAPTSWKSLLFSSQTPYKTIAGGAGLGMTTDMLTGMLTGMPGVGTAIGTGLGAAKAIGPLRLAAGGAGLYEGEQLLANSGALGAVKNNVTGADQPVSSPSNVQNDLLPGISNGWTGMLGGGLLAAILAQRNGLTGIPGLAATLLGAYGGHKYLPQMLASLKNGGGNMFNSGYGATGNIQPSYTINPQTIGQLAGEETANLPNRQ